MPEPPPDPLDVIATDVMTSQRRLSIVAPLAAPSRVSNDEADNEGAVLAALDVGPVHDSECCGYLFAWSVFGRR
jgi:hypothetical protein